MTPSSTRSVLYVADELTTVRRSADDERAIQRHRIHKLEDERIKLLQGYYDGAIPSDLMKSEQNPITSELAHATQREAALDVKFETVETNIDIAMTLASNWHHAYLASSDKERRQLNKANFQRIHVRDDGDVRDELAEPFKSMLGREVIQAAPNDSTSQGEVGRWLFVVPG